MTEERSSEDDREESIPTFTDVATTVASTTYKVLGEFAAATGAGVLGKNTAGSGTPIGVEGAVPNSASGYGLSTPDDARVLGAVDTDGTAFTVLAGTTATSAARNVVVGHASNAVNDGAFGATIAGGGSDDGTSPEPNEVNDHFGTVGGGQNNVAGDTDFNDDPTTATHATVAGGDSNDATGGWSAIGGGFGNFAKGPSSTVAGGDSNRAKTYASAVGGGYSNAATAKQATIGGGYDNTASGGQSTVGGGSNNEAKDSKATVAGGEGNIASGPRSTVGGGAVNSAIQEATVAGGMENEANAAQTAIGGGSKNVANASEATIAGGHDNDVGGLWAAIGGGKENSVTGQGSTASGGTSNAVNGFKATVGGGHANNIGADADDATIAGGTFNAAYGRSTTIGGGADNLVGAVATSGGMYATVAGGRNNVANGAYSFAAGRQADVNQNDGAFVWGDATSTSVTASESNSVTLQAGGTSRSGAAVEVYSRSDGSAGVTLPAGGGSWKSLSSADAKTDVRPVDPSSVLDRLDDLAVSTWRYESQPESVRHMGPMAGPFTDLFGLGTDDDTIATVDADGVALAAIKGLSAAHDRTADRVASLERSVDRVDDLEAENDRLRETVAARDARIDELEADVEQLRERLAAVETQLGEAATADQHAADD
jgi:hypothetical protein